MISPDYIFETSWEICNKVGGIYTVIATKANSLKQKYEDHYMLIGPDVWKETRQNPDFIEDNTLFQAWREQAAIQGIRMRTGRWNIPAQPIAILIDFTPYFTEKDQIFARFWEDYKLDSLSGQWDYIEPVLFGYGAGKVIESFYNFYLSAEDKIVAQFHEWMTGSGVLYLKDKVPQIGTVFTTHATVLGRSLAGNKVPLYENMERLNGSMLASSFGVVSKYSLEKLSARYADCFTTVSEITGKECKHFLEKEVDVVTANGFDSTMVPGKAVFAKKQKKARLALKSVAEAVSNQRVEDDAIYIINSGRYEFHNKGIDVFLDALSILNSDKKLNKQVIAFIAIPANQAGYRAEVKKRLDHPDFEHPLSHQYLTHNLYESHHDIILNTIKQKNLKNIPGDKVRVIYLPAYLDGNDGIVNLEYYDTLIGFDLSVFPSYYEPWGYTPLESVAFHVPTITTTLAGFGLWVRNHYENHQESVVIIDRDDTNDSFVVSGIANSILSWDAKAPEAIKKIRLEAAKVSTIALWDNLIENYYQAYDIALKKASGRYDLYKTKLQPRLIEDYKPHKPDHPTFRKLVVTPVLPDKLEGLRKLTQNLWWTWNYEAEDLFRSMDEDLWEQVHHNPIQLLEALSWDQLHQLENDRCFLEQYQFVLSKFEDYISEGKNKAADQIAYFSMEFGLHENLKTYSGGLGILAGDYLKEASDKNVNIIAISLLYKHGYFQQSLSAFGEQIETYIPQNYSQLPLFPVLDNSGEPLKVRLAFPGRNLNARIWRVDVGRIPLFLLDTEVRENSPEDKIVTHQLYGGDLEYRLKQELLLGVGGIRLLRKLSIDPSVYHCNEGHSAFIGVERLRGMIENDKLKFNQAVEIVRGSTLFTTHTPVPAGHDVFSEDLLRTYIPHYADRLNISWEKFMDLGRLRVEGGHNKFSMSILALNLSQEINGVSRIHGSVSREMFSVMYPGFYPEELQIGYVTNGVHYQTWTAKEWQKLYSERMGDDFILNHADKSRWKKIREVDDAVIWDKRRILKTELFGFLKKKLESDLTQRQENPKIVFNTLENLNENALTIGFARRFATYKRAFLLFSNLDRLAQVVNAEDRPVIFVFSGKAHPKDEAGQHLIKRITEISKMPEFVGKVIFLENYDMTVAKKLVQGVDLWLNTPTRPLEASGTSGEKATLNGVLNFSVLDGWWAEGYTRNAGWAIKEERTYDNQNFQDELDAETIYNILEDQIIPAFFDRNNNDIPEQWVSYIKNSLAEIAPQFTMERMLHDYRDNYYNKLISRIHELERNDLKLINEIADWKSSVNENWDLIEVKSVRVPDLTRHPMKQGEKFTVEVSIDTAMLNGNDICVELFIGKRKNNHFHDIRILQELKLIDEKNGISLYRSEMVINNAGYFDYAFRISVKNPKLVYRQDLPLVKWI